MTCKLSELCDIYGSDKGEIISEPHPFPAPSHTYADSYSSIFRHCINQIQNVFEYEIGINQAVLPVSAEFNEKNGANYNLD